MSGASVAQYGADYTAILHRQEGFRYTVTVTIGGEAYIGYGVSEDVYTIPGGDITGDVVFTVTRTPADCQDPLEPGNPGNPDEPTQPSDPADPGDSPELPPPTEPVTMHPVKFSGSGAGAAQGNATAVAHGSSYTLKLKKEIGYDYTVSYRMGGKPAVTVWPIANGVYEIHNVTAPVEILIEKTPQRIVSVYAYLTLDEKSVYLVEVTGPLGAGKIFTFDGNAMYYSESYGAWVYLVIGETELDRNAAAQRIAIATGMKTSTGYSEGDVNRDGVMDLADAQLTYELYRALQEDFNTVHMLKFLGADVNWDRKIDVRDVAAILFRIRNRKEG